MPLRDESTRKRRDAILDIVEKCPEKTITLADLLQKLTDQSKKVSLPTLRNDIDYLKRGSHPIENRRGIVSLNPQARTEFDRRFEEEKVEKDEIAQVAHAIVSGEPVVATCVLELLKGKKGWRDLSVAQVLDGFFHKSARITSLDAGTTTLEIAKKFADQDFPTDRWTHLSVVTNAYDIVRVLATNENVQTVIVGGEVRRERHSVVGHLAERSLDAFEIVTDICFCGATGIDPFRGFTSDSIMEARIKTRLLDLSKIRCIALTSNKVKRPGGTYAVFAGLSAAQLDFVVMDDKILEREEDFDRFRNSLSESGICLLTPSIVGLRPGTGSQESNERALVKDVAATKSLTPQAVAHQKPAIHSKNQKKTS